MANTGSRLSGEGGTASSKIRKLLVVVVVVSALIGGAVAKAVLLKPALPSPAQAATAATAAQLTLESSCAMHNGLPTKAAPATTTIADAPTLTGPVDLLAPITINLAGGHYLGITIALQVPAGTDPTTIKNTQNWEAVALKQTIDTLTGQTYDALSTQRQHQEEVIGEAVCRRTDGKVPTIYFTKFVMQ
jgi:flagellar basal body-associated protein FliL